MNSCNDTVSRLSAYRDGELSVEQRAIVAVHLSKCPRCTSYLHDLAEIGNLVRDERPFQLPDGLLDRITDACERQRRPNGRRWSQPWPLWMGAAAGFALYLLGYLGLASYLSARPAQPVAEAVAVERILEESQLAFAGGGLSGSRSAVLGTRPELRLLSEIEQGVKP